MLKVLVLLPVDDDDKKRQEKRYKGIGQHEGRKEERTNDITLSRLTQNCFRPSVIV